MGILGTAKSWGMSAFGYGQRGFNAGAKYVGAGGMSAGIGAVGGGIYGATAGRDPGQSRLGGAFTGALGGATLGLGARYGYAAARGAGPNSLAAIGRLTGGFNRPRNLGMAAYHGQNAARGAWSGIKAAGQRDFAALRSLAGGSDGLIGKTITKTHGKIKGLFA